MSAQCGILGHCACVAMGPVLRIYVIVVYTFIPVPGIFAALVEQENTKRQEALKRDHTAYDTSHV
jgi:hypothetical protein